MFQRESTFRKMSSDFEIQKPVTEQSNDLSDDIDTASTKEMVNILKSCDQEIFHGWKGSDGINGSFILDKISKISEKIKEVVQDPANGTVIISGCGTSGRIAFLTARTFNNLLKSLHKEACFQYIIAGDDKALFTSQELEEDDPHLGALKLKQAAEGKSKVVLIGVTCGISAPFVAGQLDYCMEHLDNFTPVLLGFNPSHLARNINVHNWNKTILDVVKALEVVEQSGKGFILNPIIGPEPITGSSRMKSGSTTRILLETLSIAAFEGLPKETISSLFKMYEGACNSVYAQSDCISSVIQLAGNSLCSGGHIYYLGCGGFGLMGMIDASECPPTYGASLDDIRGFVPNGFSTLQNKEGDFSADGSYYRISTDNFFQDILPSVTDKDLIVLVGNEILEKIDASIFAAPCQKVMLAFAKERLSIEKSSLEKFSIITNIDLDFSVLNTSVLGLTRSTFETLLQEISMKWVLNCISTGAHILKGKVLNNIMIDVKVSNNKLFHRALGIIQKYAGENEENCKTSLLKSIYNTDSLTELQKNASIEDHIKVATPLNQVVPKAILLALLKCSLKQVEELMIKQPIVRKLLKEQSQGKLNV